MSGALLIALHESHLSLICNSVRHIYNSISTVISMFKVSELSSNCLLDFPSADGARIWTPVPKAYVFSLCFNVNSKRVNGRVYTFVLLCVTSSQKSAGHISSQ